MTVVPSDLRGDIRTLLIQGRWLLVAAETLVSLVLLPMERRDVAALRMLGLLAAYNIVSLFVLQRVPLKRLPVPLVLGLDLAAAGVAAYYTGGTHSPFLGQFYLIILAGALLYDLWGGLIVGAAAAAGALAIAASEPAGTTPALTNLLPYYLLAGVFTGMLVSRLKTYYSGYSAAQSREVTAERERELARTMQQAALPDDPPDIPGIESAFVCRYAGEVGGDFLLFLAPDKNLSKTGSGIAVGDVSGKGIPAALASSGVSHLLPWLRPLNDPAHALADLNQDLIDRLPDESYATLILAEMDGTRGSLRLWSAGHPPALLWKANEQHVITLTTSSLPLGLFPDWRTEPQELSWGDGDVLLLYTDGLTETRDENGQMFEALRVGEVLTACASDSAAGIVRALQDAVEAWGTPTDDLTIVVCKRVRR